MIKHKQHILQIGGWKERQKDMPDFSVLIPGEDALKQLFTNILTGESIFCLTPWQEPKNWYCHIKKNVLCIWNRKAWGQSQQALTEPKFPVSVKLTAKSAFSDECCIVFYKNYAYMLRKAPGKLLRLEHNLFKGL